MARPKKLRFKYHSEAETWRLCIQMWRWIVDEWRRTGEPVYFLKSKWVNEFWGDGDIQGNCFFCEATNDCNNYLICPGKKIDPRFNCRKSTYHYEDKPDKFLKKILRMDEKRRRINRERRKK